jgi:uncharacterized membrane protein (UPF0127 family)
MLRSTLLALALLLAASGEAAQPHKAHASLPSISLGKGAELRIEIADNDSLRQKGLSRRRSLDWNQGMLFVFPDAAPRSFWMIDCHFDIDVAYLTRSGLVRDVVSMRIQPGVPVDQLERYPSSTGDIAYALEVNRGWFEAHGIRPGTIIRDVAHFATRR